MTHSTLSKSSPFSEDSQIWESLKQAIASSSGFERWQIEHPVEDQLTSDNLDALVRRYLRETLETLAY
ncbi:MAG: hypothetical protein F6J86_02490 [Symploca sp. SIO1B1]|nr:hypothetical protein [Symploca sp. SIO2D2]NER92723.1 hypothetical protein [Symploca sp. SIO1B1]